MLFVEKRYSDNYSKTDVSLLSGAVIRTLLYFDIFNYPLLIEEIYKYCYGVTATIGEIKIELQKLENLGYVSSHGSFYSIEKEGITRLIERRLKGNKEADRFLKIAARYSKLISRFPFVRGICLSGSLSKGYADADSDIDYFILTEPGRLWICRTFLILFKKIFLFNSHKYFCVNYFIDTDNLIIPDKNIFTATEMLSIIPTCNEELYKDLIQSNSWIKEYYPNISEAVNQDQSILPANNNVLKKGLEKLFSGKLGNKLDDYFFRLTLSTWRRKFKDFDEEQFDLSMRSRKNVSKHHPNNFQMKVIKAYSENIIRFEEKFGISI